MHGERTPEHLHAAVLATGTAGTRNAPATAASGWLSLVTDWHALHDIYGSAAGIPALLDEAASATEWDAPAWQELWGRLYHQGSVAPASYAALPSLSRIAASRAELPLDPALFLAGFILASNSGPPEMAGVRRLYADHIAALRPVAEHKLGLLSGRADVVYSLEVLAALEDLSIWQRDLERVATGELELECPWCDDYVYVGLHDGGLVAASDPDALADGQPVQPADAAGLGTAEARLLELCLAHNHTDVAAELLQLFGQAPCPHCGAAFFIADALA